MPVPANTAATQTVRRKETKVPSTQEEGPPYTGPADPPAGSPETGGGRGGPGSGYQNPANFAYNGPGATMGQSPVGSHYQGPVGFTGGVIGNALPKAGQSFSDTSRLQGALPFWQSPGIQVAAQHGYTPGQQYAGQQVTGQRIQDDPMVASALANYQQNVLPGINDQMNTMGLGRSTAALDAMAKAQAGMLTPLYQSAADLENQAINRQTQQGQFDANLSQQDLSRLQGATESELGRRQQSDQQAQQGQQQLFQNMMALSQMQHSQRQSGAEQLFGMGTTAQQTGQQANQAGYQDFLRQQGLSEEAINPFGGISGLLGTVTNGK